MYRAAFNPVKRQFNSSSLAAEYCSNAPAKRHVLSEINEVRIVGTLISDSYTMTSGWKSLLVRTNESPSRYTNHNIHINWDANLIAGQRIWTTGKLQSVNIETSDGKKITKSVVKAIEGIVLENEHGSADSTGGDQNNVELLAHIASEVLDKDDHWAFSVATNFEKRNPETGEDINDVHFHRIVVYNDNVRQYVENNLKKKDRIFLNGRITHKTYTAQDGKKWHSGAVIADSIYKLKTFTDISLTDGWMKNRRRNVRYPPKVAIECQNTDRGSFNERRTSFTADYVRFVLQKTSGCCLFDPTKSLDQLDSSQVTALKDETVTGLVSLAKQLNENPSMRDSKSALRDIATFDGYCIEDHKQWPTSTKLFVLDIWYHVRLHPAQLSNIEILLRDILKTFDQLTNGEAIQTMSYVAWTRLRLDAKETANIVRKFEKVVSELTFDQVSSLCQALVISDCEVYNVGLVSSLYDCLMAADLQKCQSIAVSGIVKAVRRSSTPHHINELINLQKKLVPYAKETDLISLTNFIQLGAKQRIFNPELIEVVLNRFTSNLNQLRNKDVERALLTISTHNRSPMTELEIQFCDSVQKMLLESLDTQFPDSSIRCISYLAICRVIDSRLIDWALNPETHAQINEKTINDHAQELLVIDSYAKINLAASYTGHTLSDNLCAILMPRVAEKKVAGKKSELIDEISDVLKTIGSQCILAKPFPYAPFPDIFLVYDKRTHKAVDGINANGIIVKANTLLDNNPDLEAIAIIPCSHRQTVFNSNRFTGLFQLKLDQLQINGFKTIVIKDENWHLHEGIEAKGRYLASEFCKNGVFLLDNCLLVYLQRTILSNMSLKKRAKKRIKGTENDGKEY